MRTRIRSILLRPPDSIERSDDKKRCFHDRPYHDWTSDFMDALRYLALSIRREDQTKKKLPTHAENDYPVLGAV